MKSKTKTKRTSTRRALTSAPVPLTSDLSPLTPPSRLTSDFRPLTSVSRNSIRHHFGFWSLDFDGHRAVFDHEQGAYYVAYLLLNPPSEPIHALALELKANALFRQRPEEPCETLIKNPATGITEGLESDAIVERGFCTDKADGLAPLRRKIEELEAILENDHASEPVKAEVQRELEEIYAYQKNETNQASVTDVAQKAVRTVRMAIRRFHERLAGAVNPQGNPHPVLRPFADYVKKNLLAPSARYSKAGRGRAKTGVAGCFTHEPPAGVQWTA